MYDAVIKLISESRTVDAYGDIVTTETERSVFAEIKSIGQSEFYQAQAVGLKPEIKFVLADYLDYQNEKKLHYQCFNEAKEEEYTILRTYRNNNLLELVCKRGVD
jgi:SPP1 family predicted phage head-tail adaptor